MMGRTIRLEVPAEEEGERLDRFLARAIEGATRSALQRILKEGGVRVDGALVSKPGLRLRRGMAIELFLAEPEAAPLEPEPIPLDVLYEDEAILVVVKPAGLVVHPGHGRRRGTLVHALLGRPTRLASTGSPDRPGIVHRLDRETSGLLVVAKEDAAYRALRAAFARREVHKTYQAIVWGWPTPPAGKIQAPIGRSRADPTKMSVRSSRGREAITRYRTVERLPGFAWLEVEILTGRTHQIRVHLASVEHPVVGDTRYGGQPWLRLRDRARVEAIRRFGRLALHASGLGFAHPVTGRTLRFESPLPADFERLLEALRGRP